MIVGGQLCLFTILNSFETNNRVYIKLNSLYQQTKQVLPKTVNTPYTYMYLPKITNYSGRYQVKFNLLWYFKG